MGVSSKENTCTFKCITRYGRGCSRKCGDFSQNSIDWSIADIATLQLRAVTVPLYATSSVEQAAYIINDADIRILLLVTKRNMTLFLS